MELSKDEQLKLFSRIPDKEADALNHYVVEPHKG